MKDFIPYEQALELKELGYNGKCFAYYNNTWNIPNELLYPQYGGEIENWNVKHHLISAPLYQQVFRFFREKYNLKFFIEYDDVNYNAVVIRSLCKKYNTYEEAELACLKELIKIAKNK